MGWGSGSAVEPLRAGDPDSVGNYRLLGRLGAGGMGQVFLGVSPGGRKVAVKLIHPVHAGAPQFRERFAREVDAAQRVGGFHTALVVDADPHADPPWMVTAYIEGPSLQEAVARDGPLPPEEVRALGAGLAEGMAAIHARRLVHRDLKPGNVILAADGPRIIDFGIARLVDASTNITATGAVVGTLAFMSPEQISGEVAGPASDVFSLGGVLAYAAMGRPPFGSDSAVSIMFRVINQPPDLVGVTDGELREVIAACLAKSPGDRPPMRVILAALSPVPTPTVAGAPAGAESPDTDHGLSAQSQAPVPTETGPGRKPVGVRGIRGTGPPRTGVVRTGAPPTGPTGSLSDGRSRAPSGSRSRRGAAAIAIVAVVAALGAVLPFLLSTSPPTGTGHPPDADPTVSSPATAHDISSPGSVTVSRSGTPGPTTSTTTGAPATVAAAGPPPGTVVYMRTGPTQGFMSGFPLHKPPCSSFEDCPFDLAGHPLDLPPPNTFYFTIISTRWSAWTTSSAVGTATAQVTRGTNTTTTKNVRVVLSRPILGCGHYFWSRVEFTMASGGPPPAAFSGLFDRLDVISNTTALPCPGQLQYNTS